MDIIDMLLTNQNSRPGKKIVPKGLVIHWTANTAKGANARANRNYFNSTKNSVSAHYIVDDHDTIRCIPEDEMAYHVGAKQYKLAAVAKLGSYPNATTVGIEMCVNTDGDWTKTYARAVQLAAEILHRRGWGLSQLYRHYDITGKDCPQMLVSEVEWQKFKNAVGVAMNQLERGPDGVRIVAGGKTFQGKLINDQTWAPVRAVAEAVGKKVRWDGSTNTVYIE